MSYRNKQKEITYRNDEHKTFSDVFSYTREWLETTDFYKDNNNILDQSRGNG